MNFKSLEKIPIRKYAKKSGLVLLVLLVCFILFTIYLNSQDLNQLQVKNSVRRKIESKYQESDITDFRNKYYIFRQNEKMKQKRGTYVNRKKPSLLNTKNMKKNISNYKNKLKTKKSKGV